MFKRFKKWYDKGGHLNIGDNFVLFYGNSTMHWAIQLYSKKYGYICIGIPSKRQKFYLYFSPNATPWASTYYIGPDKDAYVQSRVRKVCFGHNFKIYETDGNYMITNSDIMKGICNLVVPDKHIYADFYKRYLKNS